MPAQVPVPASLFRYHRELLAAYGPQRWWPSEWPLETVVGACLTQATNWRNVERSIVKLKEAGVLCANESASVQALVAIDEAELRELIRPSGHILRKARVLKLIAEWLTARHSGSLAVAAQAETAQLREELLAIPGIGPETADAILLYALGKPAAVVDEYLRRVMVRHGLAERRSRYQDLQAPADTAFAHLPLAERVEQLNEFHALIVEAGKRHCGTVPRCEGCPLSKYLPQGGPLPY